MYYAFVAWRYIRVATLYKNVEYIVAGIGEFNLTLAHSELHERHPSNCGEKIESTFL